VVPDGTGQDGMEKHERGLRPGVDRKWLKKKKKKIIVRVMSIWPIRPRPLTMNL